MHVGADYHAIAGGPGADITGRANLEFNLRHGVRHLTVHAPTNPGDGNWDLDRLRRMRDDCDRFGVTLEAIRMDSNYIRMPAGAARDRQIETIIDNIRKAASVGVGLITYHWTMIPIRRNRQLAGRGGALYQGFRLERDWRRLPAGEAGRVSSEEYWERIRYFLTRVVPAAAEYGVRLACHPYDPPGLPFGYQGVDNWDSPDIFAAIRSYEAIVDSPYNGFQLCLGTVAEGLRDPRRQSLPLVTYLARRGKIHQVHMRNIRGGLHDFVEVYPDEGELELFAIMRTLRDARYSGSILPDHMPRHPDDPGGLQAFAFGYGYLRALIEAVTAEGSRGASAAQSAGSRTRRI